MMSGGGKNSKRMGLKLWCNKSSVVTILMTMMMMTRMTSAQLNRGGDTLDHSSSSEYDTDNDANEDVFTPLVSSSSSLLAATTSIDKLRTDMDNLKRSINESMSVLTEEMRINFRNLQDSSNQQYQLLMMEIMKSQQQQQQIQQLQAQQQQQQHMLLPDYSRFAARGGLTSHVTGGDYSQYNQVEEAQHYAGKNEPTIRPLERFSPAFDDWRKPAHIRPFLKVWFFNVTNAAEFLLHGAKLRVEECGPYVYSQKWKKVGIQWHDNGSVSYKQRRKYFFEPFLSNGTETDMLLLPNVPLLSVVALSGDRSKIYKKTLSNLLDILGMEAFMPYTVKDYLWGYQEPLMTLGKQLLPPRVLERMSFDKFGVFRDKNGSESELFTVFTGKDRMEDYSRIQFYNNHVGLGAWGDGNAYTSCNLLSGSADWMTAVGSGVQPNLDRSSVISIFEPDLCRFVQFQYNTTVDHQGWASYRFMPTAATFGDVQHYPENNCFCVDGPPCDKKGLFNISPCKYGAPVFLSFPHFLHGDPSLIHAVDGLQPDPHRHQSYIDVLPASGISMEAKGRIQFNVQMARVEDIVQASYFQTVLLPVLWVEEGTEERDMTKLVV